MQLNGKEQVFKRTAMIIFQGIICQEVEKQMVECIR